MGDVLQFPGPRRTSRAADAGPVRRPAPDRYRPEPLRPLLWREAVGHELRRERREQQRQLTDVAQRAGISPQYLSEVERGRKEASSEILAAVAGSLDLELATLTTRASHTLSGTAPQLLAVAW